MFVSPGPIAFEVFGIEIRWYGVLIALGVIIGVAISYWRAPKFNISREHLVDVLLFAIPSGIIGARAYYVIFNWSTYAGDIGKIFNTREGGLAIHGGLIAAILVGACVCKYHKMVFRDVLDLIAPSVALGQAIGRWGNFFNSEAHGGETDLPWAVIVDGKSVHPTFLYESIWCFILFIILMIMSKNIKFSGQIFSVYVILYSLERFAVEELRTDSLMIGPFKQAQVISCCLIIVFVLVYMILNKKETKK